jgi:hypothetical protein
MLIGLLHDIYNNSSILINSFLSHIQTTEEGHLQHNMHYCHQIVRLATSTLGRYFVQTTVNTAKFSNYTIISCRIHRHNVMM